MLVVSQAFKNLCKGTTRVSKTEVSFAVEDIVAKTEVVATASEAQVFSDPQDVADYLTKPRLNLATYETNYFNLSGLFNLVPDDIGLNDGAGWWSLNKSNASAVFASPPTLTLTFPSLHDTTGITLYFDPSGGTYAPDFTVQWYATAVLLATSTITTNASTRIQIDQVVTGYNKIVFTFNKSNVAERYMRVEEVILGFEELFDSNQIVSANLTEESDPSSGTLSINKLTFTVLNESQKFNMINPSGIYSQLQTRQRLFVKSGLEMSPGVVEWVDMGPYYLSEWKNATGITATLTGTDLFGLLDKTTFYSSLFWQDTSITTILQAIFNDAGSFQFTVDASLSAVTLTGYIPVKSHREAVQDVLIAAGASVKYGRDGIPVFYKPVYSNPVDTIGFGQVLGEPVVEQLPLVSVVSIPVVNYSYENSAQLLETEMSFVGQKVLLITFDFAPADTISVGITGSGTIIGSPAVSVTAMQIEVAATGTFTLTVTGKKWSQKNSVASASLVLATTELPQSISISENKLVSNEAQAIELCADMLAYYQKRIKQTFGFADNPAIEAGDYVLVDNMFGTTSGGIIEVHDMQLAPGLRSRMTVVG